MQQLGIYAIVTGEVRPYSLTNEDTGEAISGVNLRVTGEAVGVRLEPDLVDRFNVGEIWRVEGWATVSSSAKLQIIRPEKFTRLTKNSPSDQKIQFSDESSQAKAS